jgi:hypothetical protein
MPPRHLRVPDHAAAVRRLWSIRQQAPRLRPLRLGSIRLRSIRLLVPAVVVAAATATTVLNQPAAPAYLGYASATILDVVASKPADRPHTEQVASMATPGPAPSRSSAPRQPPAPSEKVLAFDFQIQHTYYFCGPTATHMVLSARGVNLSQEYLAGRLGTTTYGTDSAADTTRVLNSVLNTSFYRTHAIPGQSATAVQADQLRSDVVHAISNGYAVVANIAGSATDQSGGWHDFAGHYVAIVGYRDGGQSVKIADSSGMFGAGTYWMSTTAAANWIATHGYSA